MSLDLKFLGKKIRGCREQLELNTQEVSTKTGITPSRINEIEEGEKEPTGDEILIFADFFKQDYRFFINNQQKTASNQIDILYRKFGDEFSKEDRWAVQEFIYLCECEEAILTDLNFEKSEFLFRPTGNYYKQHAVEAAKELRKKFGYKPSSIIKDIYSDFRQIGIHVFRRKLNNANFSGLFINHPWAGKCVLVNYSEDVFRQNFTVAHEIAHAIFDYKEDVTISFSQWDKNDLKEIRANNFASHYLVPPESLTALNVNIWNEEIVKQLCLKLNVNIETLLIALKSASLIGIEESKKFKSIRIPKNAKEDPELRNHTPKRRAAKLSLLEKGLSTFYVTKCHEAYLSGYISARRLAEMYLTDETGLLEILDLFNLQLVYDD